MRCAWATRQPDIDYHDREWGVPEHDDRKLFELLALESAQAGLSWRTILLRRDGYRTLFAGFDPAVVARFDDDRIDALASDVRIVRHRGKIAATVANARAFEAVQREAGSFAAYLWAFVAGRPVVGRRAAPEATPASTPLSERVSRDLRARGFTFVGPTIVYAFLAASGVVDDHLAECFLAKD
ncbi:MAG: DNA-3-methyladenine glycosylase I [Vulcanimicrobiaceae bacterium]